MVEGLGEKGLRSLIEIGHGPNPPRVAIFGPNPLLSVTIEARGAAGDDIHLHPAGQGIWVARMAAELGARPILCGLLGGETGDVLEPLPEQLGGELRLVRTTGATGAYLQDRRGYERRLVAESKSQTPSRHELDELISTTCAAAIDADVLVVCNSYPGEILPTDVYGTLVSDVRQSGTAVLVDLSSPRLDSSLSGRPELAKLNDWELAEYVSGPVDTPARLRGAAERIRDAGAGIVVVTRGERPALVLRGEEAWTLTPPSFDRGFREGCGDSMMGAIAAIWAGGANWQQALIAGAAAGAANFLRQGLGTGSRPVVEDLAAHVTLEPAAG